MIETKTEPLYTFMTDIKGNEPYLSWPASGVYLRLNRGAQSHVLIENFGLEFLGTNRFKKGDTFQVRIERVTIREISWWQKIKEWWKNDHAL